MPARQNGGIISLFAQPVEWKVYVFRPAAGATIATIRSLESQAVLV